MEMRIVCDEVASDKGSAGEVEVPWKKMEMRIALVAITVWNILGQVPSSTATVEL